MACTVWGTDYDTIKSIQFLGDGITEPTNWKKGEWIGQGAYGSVYKATVGDITIAVKAVSRRKKKNEECVKKETDALKELSNERVIKYYGFCAADQMYYIFLEFMNGGSLDDFIGEKVKKGEKIDEVHAGRIISQIVQGVAYLHEKNFFHRDIKSANVLMSDAENVKLADFGLTRLFADVPKTYSRAGTPRFMAPEMVIPKGHYSNPVDIWAIGCILVHMLSGEYPFPDVEEQQLPIQLFTDATPAKNILSTVSKNCQRFLEKTLAIEPEKRATAESLLCDHFVTGQHENQVSEGVEADLHKHLTNCLKNPGHPEFIPIESFILEHLPEGYHHSDLYEFIKAAAQLTVRLRATMTSPDGAEFWPNTKIRYFLSDMRGKTTPRTGTGRVWRVKKFTDKDKESYYTPYKCNKCKALDVVSKVWSKIFVHTAAHVVVDDIKASHTTLRLFNDSEESELVILKIHVHVDSVDIERYIIYMYIHMCELRTFICVNCD